MLPTVHGREEDKTQHAVKGLERSQQSSYSYTTLLLRPGLVAWRPSLARTKGHGLRVATRRGSVAIRIYPNRCNGGRGELDHKITGWSVNLFSTAESFEPGSGITRFFYTHSKKLTARRLSGRGPVPVVECETALLHCPVPQ
ncbi:hypothetical protein RRG08_055313 [Elysia crispata]|uniref:Uncharacterized protein n=1 Tax=Elysia crispata TaxID=231223 RepID=A0AAE1E2N1_9GAST|nr:hypothetical protein RRG08_055313 [Elysia crispata]